MSAPRFFALIPAAGIGERSGASCPKQYRQLAGKPMLAHVLDTFAATPAIAHTFVVVSAADDYIEAMLTTMPHLAPRISVLRTGGATRQASVLNGLLALRSRIDDADWVLVHDAARPGLTREMIEAMMASLQDDAVGGLLALPVVDTLRRSTPDDRAAGTVSRSGLWSAQTPQMFPYALLCRALAAAVDVTDEAGAIEALGLAPRLVVGSPRNFKVTLPHDFALAELYLKGLA